MINTVNKIIKKEYLKLFELYKHLHQNPELSLQEKESAATLVNELKSEGIEVVTNIWGYGFLGILKNGEGSTIMIRTDLDALPLTEKTGISYACTKTTLKDGKEVGLMHACGHDMHMTVFAGTAKTLAKMKAKWSGTILFLGQPAEEIGKGAKGLIENGLLKKYPKPENILAYHIAPDLEAGKIGYTQGYSFANVDMIDLEVYGIGGHGASPHKTKDPIVIASEIVLALQKIVSRELSPLESAVVTVGSIHGGTTHNIIPSEVKLELTCRSYSNDVRKKIIEAIDRISKGIAISAGLSEENLPMLTVRDSYAPAVYNDPKLVEISANAIKEFIGTKNVIEVKSEMIAEDFAWYGLTEEKIPINMLRLGTVDPKKKEDYLKLNKTLPGLHSPYLAPDPETTIKTGIRGLTAAILKLLSE